MRTLSGMFPFANWVISTLKSEAVIFLNVDSACVHASHVDYLGKKYLGNVHHE